MKDILFGDAKRNRENARSMIKSKHYDWGLFVWHLSLEKALKGLLAQESKDIPFIHNLSKLAKKTALEFTEEQFDQLDEITTFNLEARYDDYKYAFYKRIHTKVE